MIRGLGVVAAFPAETGPELQRRMRAPGQRRASEPAAQQAGGRSAPSDATGCGGGAMWPGCAPSVDEPIRQMVRGRVDHQQKPDLAATAEGWRPVQEFCRLISWPECSTQDLRPLYENASPLTVLPDDLNQIAPASPEHEQTPGERILY